MAELTALENENLLEASKLLPASHQIVEKQQLDTILAQNADMVYVLKTLKPLLALGQGNGGGNNPMAFIQNIMPAITDLKNNEELKAALDRVQQFI